MTFDSLIPDIVRDMEKWALAHEQGYSTDLPDNVAAESVVQGVMRARHWLELLEEDQLRRIIKGYILLSSQQFTSGIMGSASPCRFLYQAYAKLFPEQEADLYAWIVKHRNNPYDPFGSHDISLPDTLEAYRAFKEAAEQKRNRNLAQEETRQAQERLLKQDKEWKMANRNLAPAIQRGDFAAVKSLVAKGANPILPVDGHTNHIEFARQHGRSEIVAWLEGL